MIEEKEIDLWGAIEPYSLDKHKYCFCFEDKNNAEDFTNEFHLYFIRPFKIKYKIDRTNDYFNGHGSYIEYEVVVMNGLDYFFSDYIYYSSSVNTLRRKRKIDGVIDNQFGIIQEFSSLPDFIPSIWYSDIITAYLRELRVRL